MRNCDDTRLCEDCLSSQNRSVRPQLYSWHTPYPSCKGTNAHNFVRRFSLPEVIKRWSLTSVQTRLNKIGGRLALHVRRLVFQLAEVVVSRDMFSEMLEMIGRLRSVPG